jgi:hypothetical protein
VCEVTEMLTRLVEEAAKHSINNHDMGLAQATAKLVLAMKSDGLLGVDDIRTYQLIMEYQVESGAIKLSPDRHAFFVGRSLPLTPESREYRRI